MQARAAGQITLALIGISFCVCSRLCISGGRTPTYSTAPAGTNPATLPNPVGEYRHDGIYYYPRTGYSSSWWGGSGRSSGGSGFWSSWGSGSSSSDSSWGSSSGGSSSVSRGGFGSSSSGSS